MDRIQLRNFIDSGRAVAMDVFAVSQDIPPDSTPGPLFNLDILNKTVLIKQFGAALPTARRPVVVDTKVYFPYDNKNPYDGGESIAYSNHSFGKELVKKITYGGDESAYSEALERDLEVLDFLHNLYSLDPFILKSYALKQEFGKRIDEAYFRLPVAEWKLIEQPIRDKVFRLVTKAIGVSAKDAQDDATLQYVARFLRKIWEAKDVDGIEPFVEAMQLPAHQAADAFFAWKAVSYYQVRFEMLGDDLKAFLIWLGDAKAFYPAEFKSLPESHRAELVARIDALKGGIKTAYGDIHRILGAYERAYHLFLFEDRPATFKEFLMTSDASNITLARCVSVFWHAVNVHQMYSSSSKGRITLAQFLEILQCLSMLFGVETTEGA